MSHAVIGRKRLPGAARMGSAQEMVDLVVRSAAEFGHAGFQDDVTVLALQRCGGV